MSDELVEEALVAALVAGAQKGLPTDIQGLLLRGNAAQGIPPGILKTMVTAAIKEHEDNITKIHEMLFPA